MQFLLIAYDGTDADAPRRRQAVREAHLNGVAAMKNRREALYGAAVLNESGQMIGSMMVLNFPDRKALDAWLAQEPYITEKVWERIEIQPAQTAPAFMASPAAVSG